jgi:hypothetical protein
MLTFVFLLCLALSGVTHAGVEATVSGSYDLDREDRQGRLSFGYTQGPIWAEAGIRQEDSLDAAVGLRQRLGPVELRVGAVGVLAHEGSHDFGGDYGEDEQDAYAFGGVVEVSTGVGTYRPFARYQRLEADHDYRETRQVGTTPSGTPIYGDPVSHSETERVDEVVIGVRMGF